MTGWGLEEHPHRYFQDQLRLVRQRLLRPLRRPRPLRWPRPLPGSRRKAVGWI